MYVCICNKDMQYRYVIQIFNTDITNDMQYRDEKKDPRVAKLTWNMFYMFLYALYMFLFLLYRFYIGVYKFLYRLFRFV